MVVAVSWGDGERGEDVPVYVHFSREILRLLGPFGLGCVLFYLYVMWESPLIVSPLVVPCVPCVSLVGVVLLYLSDVVFCISGSWNREVR